MVQVELYLTKVQFRKFNKGDGFQVSASQLTNKTGEHEVSVDVDKKLFNRIRRNTKNGKAIRLPKGLNRSVTGDVEMPMEGSVEGGSIKSDFKKFGRKLKKAFKPAVPVLTKIGKAVLPVAKEVGKAVISKALPMAGEAGGVALGSYIGGPGGALVGKELGSVAGKAGASAINKQIGSGMGKGSQAMREKMAKLRAMRKIKGSGHSIDGEGLVNRKVKRVTIPVATPVSRASKVKNPRVRVRNSLLLNGVPQVSGLGYASWGYA